MIRIGCTKCGAQLKVPAERAGSTGKCPKCGERLVIPRDAAESAATSKPHQGPTGSSVGIPSVEAGQEVQQRRPTSDVSRDAPIVVPTGSPITEPIPSAAERTAAELAIVRLDREIAADTKVVEKLKERSEASVVCTVATMAGFAFAMICGAIDENATLPGFVVGVVLGLLGASGASVRRADDVRKKTAEIETKREELARCRRIVEVPRSR